MPALQARGYALLAGVCDFYFVSFALGALAAFGGCVFQQPIPLPLLFMLPLSALVVTLFYQLVVAQRVTWCSPGEALVGRVHGPSGKKAWCNPYHNNRWALFAVILITIMLSSSADHQRLT